MSSLRWHYPDQVRRSKTLVFLSVWFTQTPVLSISLSSKASLSSKVRLTICLKKTGKYHPPKYSIDEADSIWVVVNKQRHISPLKYQPTNLVFPAFAKPKVQNPFGLQLREEAALATEEMAAAMTEEGIGTLILNSGFRTYKNQQCLYNRTRDTRGLAVAEKLSARPGHS